MRKENKITTNRIFTNNMGRKHAKCAGSTVEMELELTGRKLKDKSREKWVYGTG